MKTSLMSVSAVAMLAAAVSFLCVARPSPRHSAAPTTNAEGTQLRARLPVAFVPNVGQWESHLRFVARIGAMTVFLDEQGWTFTLVERTAKREKGKETANSCERGVAVRMTFAGASPPELAAEDQLPGLHNYFLGNDSSRWRSDVPLYRAVRYRGVHPGVDVRAREQDGHFEYDLVLQPGAELGPVEIAVEGSDRMQLDGDGALVLATRLGPVRMPAPLSWEEGPSGERNLVACRYVMRGQDRFGFAVIGRRPGWALVVDPGLLWSTLLGGADSESIHALALDAQGAATIAGDTGSIDFPTTPGAFGTSRGGASDAFVTRVSPNGSNLIYSTFLGGKGNDRTQAVALDAQGAATVAGFTDSTDFPTTLGALDTIFNGVQDAFVCRLSPAGSTLVYSTFLGGALSDEAKALLLDAQGATTVAGMTLSSDFPTTPGAFDTTHAASSDAFVTRLSPAGSSLVYSTFLGGDSGDSAYALALDAQGATTVAGVTSSTNFPTTPGAFDTTYGGSADGFVARLSPTGSSLVYSTFLGGNSGESALAVALDARGATTVAGATSSSNFPTTPGAFDTTYSGAHSFGSEAFVTRLSPTGSSLVYSTFLGGTFGAGCSALALDPQGAATVAGVTWSIDFTTTLGAFDAGFNGGVYDAFVTRLSPTGSSLVYSTFLGGMGDDNPFALALDAQGAATVAGRTHSANFPTTPGAFDTTFTGVGDSFVTRLDMLPASVSAFGTSSPGCAGPLAISVTSMPRIDNASFALTCGNAPANTTGLLALTSGRLPSAVIVLGVEVWIDPASVFVALPTSSNDIGATHASLPIPNDAALALARVRLYAQFFWAGTDVAAAMPVLRSLGLERSRHHDPIPLSPRIMINTSFVSGSAVAMLAAAVSFLCVARPSPRHSGAPTTNAEGTELLVRLPVAFVPNLGQREGYSRFAPPLLHRPGNAAARGLVSRTPALHPRPSTPATGCSRGGFPSR